MRLSTAFAHATKMAAIVTILALGGCGGDGVSLNGGVFDALGVSDKGDKDVPREPRLAERSGLIMPPRLEQLPTPGSGDTAQQNWPVSPEQRRVAANQQKEAEHAAYCEKELRRKKINRDLSVTEGPLGNCNQSALSAIGLDPNQTLRQSQSTGPAGLPK